jgi:cold shock CspA family protein
VDKLATGRVLQFDATRGYGFVAADDGGEDVFLHASVFDGGLEELVPGMRVEFQIMAGDRGRKAFGAHRVAESGAPGEHAPPPAAQAAQELHLQPEPEPPAQPAEIDEQMCDVLPADGFSQEVTELLLSSAPTLTGQQILQVRHSVREFAAKHGWLDL